MDEKAEARWLAEMRDEQIYRVISKVLGCLAAVVTLIACWIAAIAQWGWLLGIAFGWIPALIIAAIVGFLIYALWGVAVALGLAVAVWFFVVHK